MHGPSISSSLNFIIPVFWYCLQILKFVVMQLSPTLSHFFPLMFKYFSQYPLLKETHILKTAKDRVSCSYITTNKLLFSTC